MVVYSPVTAVLPTKRKAESDLADEIEESSGEIEENDGVIEEMGDEIKKSTDEIKQIGDEIGESGDENGESGEDFEEIGDENEEESGGNFDVTSYIESVNEYFRSTWITPKWEVDSFDGLEFDPSQEKTEYLDDYDDVNVEQWLIFRKQHIENKGFFVEPELWPMYKYSEYRVIRDLEKSAGNNQTYHMYFKEMACLCLERYNKEQKERYENFIDVEFVEVVGGVVKDAKKSKAFITFKAKERPDGPLVEYQAKVWSDIVKPGVIEDYPILCRPAPPPKLSN